MPGQKSSVLHFHNSDILRDHHIIREDLWVRDGIILNPEKLFFEERVQTDVQIDCDGALIAPGFIDVQINGAFGVDFSFYTEDLPVGIRQVAKGLLAHGVTSFCPTVVTSPAESYKKVLPLYQRTAGSKDGASILGVHVEGPFISYEKRGAHLAEHLQTMTSGIEDILNVYGSLENVSLVTLAPELTGAMSVVAELVNRGIKVSVGHSIANLSEGETAVKKGASFITHLFNAMLPFHHRDPHLVGLLASDQIPVGRTVYYGLISDGIHTQPAALRIAHRTHPTGLVLVTDAAPGMGCSQGTYHMGTQKVEIKGDRAVIAGTDMLCGSIASLDQCVRYFFQSTECTHEQALESASLHAAEMLGISHRKGTLDYGADADFVILDNELRVHATYIAGEKVWTKSGGLQQIERHRT